MEGVRSVLVSLSLIHSGGRQRHHCQLGIRGGVSLQPGRSQYASSGSGACSSRVLIGRAEGCVRAPLPPDWSQPRRSRGWSRGQKAARESWENHWYVHYVGPEILQQV